MNKNNTLKEKILEALKEGDIASLYVLELQAQEELNEDELHGYYANILDLALENLTNILENHRRANLSDVQDFATIRALYEYAMEHYSAKDTKSASALFEVLSGLSEDKTFSNAMKIHQHATDANISLDDFLDNYADIETTQKEQSFYLSHFQKKAQNLLKNSQSKGK